MKRLIQFFIFLGFLSPLKAETRWDWVNPKRTNLDTQIRETWKTSAERIYLKTLPEQPEFLERIEELERQFLEMSFDQLLQGLEELERDMWAAPLYPRMNEDFFRLYELKVLSELTINKSISPTLKKRLPYFLQSEEFRSRMPKKIRDLAQAETLKVPKNVYLFGKREDGLQLPAGEYYAIQLDFPYEVQGKLLPSGSAFEFQETKRVLLTEILKEDELEKLLKSSRPSASLILEISIQISEHQKLHFIGTRPEKKAFTKPEQAQLTQDWDANFEVPLNPGSEKRKSFLRSPWLWGLIGAAAIGGGYLVYEANRTSGKVHTP